MSDSSGTAPAPALAPIPELDERARHGTDHERAVRSMFDRIAPTYDLLNRTLSAGVDVSWRKKAVAELARAPEGTILDSCAGTMDLTQMIARAYPQRKVIAADFAAQMLEAGKHKAPEVERIVADAMDLPFERASMAAVVCGFGMRNLADTPRGVHEAHRVLTPGGLFVTLEFFQPSKLTSRAFHATYAKLVLPTVGGIVSGDREAYSYLARSMEGFLRRPEYEALLVKMGFRRVVGRDLLFGVASLVVAEKGAAS